MVVEFLSNVAALSEQELLIDVTDDICVDVKYYNLLFCVITDTYCPWNQINFVWKQKASAISNESESKKVFLNGKLYNRQRCILNQTSNLLNKEPLDTK